MYRGRRFLYHRKYISLVDFSRFLAGDGLQKRSLGGLLGDALDVSTTVAVQAVAQFAEIHVVVQRAVVKA